VAALPWSGELTPRLNEPALVRWMFLKMKKITTYEYDIPLASSLSDLKSHCPAAWQMSGSGIGLVSGPATMVGLGFRCWVRGVQTHDTRFFDVCGYHYAQRFGLKDGLVLATKLGQWVDALLAYKTKPMAIYEDDACGFSYDEVMAISMIAACQHGECPALRACLHALSHTNHFEKQENAARDFSDGLIDAGQILDPSSIALPLMAMGDHNSSFTH